MDFTTFDLIFDISGQDDPIQNTTTNREAKNREAKVYHYTNKSEHHDNHILYHNLATLSLLALLALIIALVIGKITEEE